MKTNKICHHKSKENQIRPTLSREKFIYSTYLNEKEPTSSSTKKLQETNMHACIIVGQGGKSVVYM